MLASLLMSDIKKIHIFFIVAFNDNEADENT